MFMEKDQENEEEDEDEDEERPKISLASLIKLEVVTMSTGGIRMNIGQDEKKMAQLEQ